MIPALLFALQTPTIPVTILAEPGDELRFEAVVLIPKDLDADDRAMLPALAAAMAKATDDFPPSTISTLTDGRPILVEAMPDHVRISFGVAANAESAGLDLLASILRRPLLRDGGTARLREGFYAGLLNDSVATSSVPANELQTLYGAVIRPERMRIAIAGPASVEAGPKLLSRLTPWPAPPRLNPYRKRPKLAVETPKAGSLVLKAPPVPYEGLNLPLAMIAWAAVGSGKGSALFRVSRESLGISYRQESALLPTQAGLVPAIIVGTDHPDADALRKGLLDDIDTWTEEDLTRSKGILRASAETGLPLAPLLLSPDGPLSNDPADRAFLAAYWPLRTGTDWNPLYWAANVSLDDVKRTAKEWVQNARSPGKGDF